MTSGDGKKCRHHFVMVVTENFSLTTKPYQRGGHFFRHVRTVGKPHFAAHQIKLRWRSLIPNGHFGHLVVLDYIQFQDCILHPTSVPIKSDAQNARLIPRNYFENLKEE